MNKAVWKLLIPKKRALAHLNLPKLDDALEAGRERRSECTLILTEGDSAKALAVAGLSVVGRDLFGVYPIRGKLLNVRDVSPISVAENSVGLRNKPMARRAHSYTNADRVADVTDVALRTHLCFCRPTPLSSLRSSPFGSRMSRPL